MEKQGYWISAYRSVRDSVKVSAYAKLAAGAIQEAGGRFVVRGGRIMTFEAGIEERTVIVEFDSFDAAIAAYHSEPYRRALAALGDGAERDLRIVEGI